MVGAGRVQVERASRPRPGEVWVFVGGQGQLIAHRCWRTRPQLYFQGDANRAPDPPLDPDHLVGRVTAIERDGRWQIPAGYDRARGLLVLRYQSVRRVLGQREPAWLRNARRRDA